MLLALGAARLDLGRAGGQRLPHGVAVERLRMRRCRTPAGTRRCRMRLPDRGVLERLADRGVVERVADRGAVECLRNARCERLPNALLTAALSNALRTAALVDRVADRIASQCVADARRCRTPGAPRRSRMPGELRRSPWPFSTQRSRMPGGPRRSQTPGVHVVARRRLLQLSAVERLPHRGRSRMPARDLGVVECLRAPRRSVERLAHFGAFERLAHLARRPARHGRCDRPSAGRRHHSAGIPASSCRRASRPAASSAVPGDASPRRWRLPFREWSGGHPVVTNTPIRTAAAAASPIRAFFAIRVTPCRSVRAGGGVARMCRHHVVHDSRDRRIRILQLVEQGVEPIRGGRRLRGVVVPVVHVSVFSRTSNSMSR